MSPVRSEGEDLRVKQNAIREESDRTRVARKFIPVREFPEAQSVPADVIDNSDSQTLRMEIGPDKPLIEIWVEFALTEEQNTENDLRTAATLARRASNLLAQAEDAIIFQGSEAGHGELFSSGRVKFRPTPPIQGLLDSTDQFVRVDKGDQLKHGKNTFTAVVEACSILQSRGHYGPYALVLHIAEFAALHSPLEHTLSTPADWIGSLVTKGIYGSGALPQARGILVSLGGNTIDLALGNDATTSYLQVDDNNMYWFRVYQRFLPRVKDRTAIVRLEFEPTAVKAKDITSVKKRINVELATVEQEQRNSPLRDLRVRRLEQPKTALQQIAAALGDRAWMLDSLASEPFILEGALAPSSIDDLVESFLRHGSVDLDASQVVPYSEIAAELVLFGLYPSGAVRGLPGVISRESGAVTLHLHDVVCLFDPDSEMGTIPSDGLRYSVVVAAFEALRDDR